MEILLRDIDVAEERFRCLFVIPLRMVCWNPALITEEHVDAVPVNTSVTGFTIDIQLVEDRDTRASTRDHQPGVPIRGNPGGVTSALTSFLNTDYDVFNIAGCSHSHFCLICTRDNTDI